ncbi:hypothetical protein QBC39DRAFT_424285 [Podospora conica]|nr:hypothetical protein QBC39DRAFT_424285 [Schizothecium conicum]
MVQKSAKMLFPEEDAPHLKKWIVKRIENTSDADADVLADYVLALLRHDGSPDDVRKLCESEIPDFLKEDPSGFVNEVFEIISYKSYLPGAPPPPSKTAPSAARAPLPPGVLSYDDTPMAQATGPKGSKKRGFNERPDGDAPHNGPEGRPSKRSLKQARRGGRGGRGDEQNGHHENGMLPGMQGLGGQFPNFAPFDPKAAMDAFLAMQPGFPVPPPPGRKRCRDYDTKGYCARGNSCNFQHGEYNMFTPPTQVGSFGGPAPQSRALEGMDSSRFQFWPPAEHQAEYDPTNALLSGMFGAPGFAPPFTSERGGHGQRGRGGKNQDSRRKGRPRAAFSADGPVTDKTKSTIVVESIPEENFDEDQVRGFFSQFGTIVEVSMRPYKRLAIVKFDNWAAANAAYKSPKAIFENRFVKVFWYKEESAQQGTASSNGAAGSATAPQAASSTESPAAAPEIDMEEFLRKQEEAQKAHEEKMRKLEEVQRQRQELEKRQEELLVKRLEEEKKLLAKLKETSGTKSAERTSQSEALRAQLAVLEAEAMLLGLDPDAEAEAEADQPWTPRGGGYGYGRGRGYPRARGYAPRGAPRGSFRGRGSQHAAYAAYSLDNRPKKLIVSGVDFTVPGTDESLRQYLFGIGEFTDIQSADSTAEVTFKDRKTAEKFYYGVKLNNGTIPGIDSHVELAWIGGGGSSAGSTPTPGTATPSASKGFYSGADKASGYARLTQAQLRDEEGNGAMMESSGASVSSDKDVHIVLDRSADQMDYDVADPNQWDVE